MSFDDFKNLSPFPGFENDPFPPMPSQPPQGGNNKKPQNSQMQNINNYVQTTMGTVYNTPPNTISHQQHHTQMGFADVNFSLGYGMQQPQQNYYSQNNPNSYYDDTSNYMHSGMIPTSGISGMNQMNPNLMVGRNPTNNSMGNQPPPAQNMMNYNSGGGGGGGGGGNSGGNQMGGMISSMNTNFVETLFAPPHKRIKYEDGNNTNNTSNNTSNNNNNPYYTIMQSPNANTPQTPQNPSPKSPNICSSPNPPNYPPPQVNIMGMNNSMNNAGQVLNNIMTQLNSSSAMGANNNNQIVLNKECVLHLAKRVNNDLNVLIKFINAIEGEYIPNQNLLVSAKTSITKFTESLHHSLTPSFRDDPPQTDLSNTSLADYTLLDTLGTGTFGRVRLCKYNVTNEYFCVKILSKEKVVRLKQQEHVKSEKSILLSSKHPFIVKLYTTFQDEKNLYFIMEYVSGGELFTLIKKAGCLSTSVARIYAAEIILVIEYLHGRNIIHRDLKPENVLIDKLGHLKLTDFGFAKFISNEKTWTMCGTPEYIAPEIILSKGHDKCVDWWSLGVLLFEMLAGHPPFQGDNNYSVFQNILSGEVTFPPHFDPAAADLITKLLSLDITQRLGCMKAGPNDVKNHRFFAGVDWEGLLKKRCWGPIHPNVGFANDTSNFVNSAEEPDELSSAFTGDQNIFKEF